ncbi:MAG: hypothetical protein N3E52_04300 [Candidatus Bathyarchaeota archaeon]|nr:hypothetical protein [Candidatus Bathyarchaeota archaeon]
MPIISEFRLGAFESGILMSIGCLSIFCEALACGILADRIGRKPGTIVYLAMAGIRTTLLSQAFAPESILLWSIVISWAHVHSLRIHARTRYPAYIRGTGSGATLSIGPIEGTIAPILTPLLHI